MGEDINGTSTYAQVQQLSEKVDNLTVIVIGNNHDLKTIKAVFAMIGTAMLAGGVLWFGALLL